MLKDFDRWFSEFNSPPLPEVYLPEGVIESTQGGEYEAECVSCERWTLLPCDLSEIPAVGYRHYCGGGPRCCP